jgi:hypothetical protein
MPDKAETVVDSALFAGSKKAIGHSTDFKPGLPAIETIRQEGLRSAMVYQKLLIL